MYEFYPNAIPDSVKYDIPFTDIGITVPNQSNIYFALLYKILAKYIHPINTIDNSRVLLNEGGYPLLSNNNIVALDKWAIKLMPFYLIDNTYYAITLHFGIIATNELNIIAFSNAFNITSLLSWNMSSVLLYRYNNYFNDWFSVSEHELILYLLNIGLYFRNSQTFSIVYFKTSVEPDLWRYQFNARFKLNIPEYYNQISAEEVI
jgi:hypothetical protein